MTLTAQMQPSGSAQRVQEMYDAGESEESIARFIAGQEEFTPAERALAKAVLRRYGLRRSTPT